jgi:peroxiredoxin
LGFVSRLRPRLLVVSLLVAVAVVGAFAWVRASDNNSAAPEVRLGANGVVTYPEGGLANKAVTGKKFPDVTLLDAAGNKVKSADLLGRPLVVNMWFSTCGPCAKELPAFAAVDAETDVRIVGVNTVDSVDSMQKFANDRGVKYELLRDPNAELVDGIGAVAFPVTLFITSDGTIIDQTGALNADELRQKVANLIKVDAAK